MLGTILSIGPDRNSSLALIEYAYHAPQPVGLYMISDYRRVEFVPRIDGLKTLLIYE